MEISYEVAQLSLLVLDTDKTGGVDAIRSYLQDTNGFSKGGNEEDIRRFLEGIRKRLGDLVIGPPIPASPISPITSLDIGIGETIQRICTMDKYRNGVCTRFSPDPYRYLISLAEAYSEGRENSPFKGGKQVIDDLNRYIQAVRDGYAGGYEKGKMALEGVLKEISKKYPKRTESLKHKRLEFMGIAIKYCIAMILETEQEIPKKSANESAMVRWIRGKIGELLDLSMGGLLPPTSRKTMKRHR